MRTESPNRMYGVRGEPSSTVSMARPCEVARGNADHQFVRAVGHAGERQGQPWLERWFVKQYGDSRRIEVSVPSFLLLPSFLTGTNRIATLQARLAHKLAGSAPLKVVEAPLQLPRLVEVLQWNAQRDVDPALSWLREQVITAAAELPPCP
jgi:LysR family nod box-dependent transcriptional activator